MAKIAWGGAMVRWILRSVAGLLAAGPALALDCGGGEPCRVAGGEYHIAVPEDWQGGPAVLHLHGYGGSGAKVVRNKGFTGKFTARGYAVIAPTALPWREGKPTDWSVRDGWITYPRDDLAFLRDVLADAAARAGVDPAAAQRLFPRRVDGMGCGLPDTGFCPCLCPCGRRVLAADGP